MLSEIFYLKAEGDYVFLNLKNGEKILLRDTLVSIEQTIESSLFFRIHRSFLINLYEIETINLKDRWAQVGGERIPISRKQYSLFLEKIKKLG